MKVLRGGILALGVVVGLYGAYLLLSREGDFPRLSSTVEWLAAGVVLSDFVLAPLLLVVAAVGGRVLPQVSRAPAVVGLVVLGSATLFAIPVLTRNGALEDNPTLLDRNYTVGWLVLAGLVLLAVVVASVLRARHERGSGPTIDDPPEAARAG